MPSISQANVAAGTANALDGLKFRKIPARGALISLYASTAAAGGNVDLSSDDGVRSILDGAVCNIESSADVVDRDRDVLLVREPVGPGELFLAVNAQIVNFVLEIEYV